MVEEVDLILTEPDLNRSLVCGWSLKLGAQQRLHVACEACVRALAIDKLVSNDNGATRCLLHLSRQSRSAGGRKVRRQG